MQAIWRVVGLSFLMMGCAGAQETSGFYIEHTLVNYETGVKIAIKESHTDQGQALPHKVFLMSASKLYTGATAGGIGKGSELPEWIEISWRESGPEWHLTNEEYRALGEAATQAHFKAYRELLIKSAKILVRSRIPVTVIEELKNSPRDPAKSSFPLKKLRLYLIWTREGVKLRWRVYEKCCKVLHEGGDAIR